MGDVGINNQDYSPGFIPVKEEDVLNVFEATEPMPEPSPGFVYMEDPLYLQLMPNDPLIQAKIEEQIRKADDPQEEKAKIMTSLYLNKLYGTDLDFAYNNQSEIIKEWTGKEIGSQDFFRNLSNSWKAGEINAQLGYLGFELLLAYTVPDARVEKTYEAPFGGVKIKAYGERETDEIWKQIEELKKQMPSVDLIKAGIPEQALNYAAQQLPIWLKSAERGLEIGLPSAAGAAGIAAIAGQAGPQALAPEEIVTVPAAALSGFSMGMTFGSMESIGRIEAGLAFIEMVEDGIDPNIAMAASLGVGLINAGLEMVQLKGLAKPFRGIINATTKKIVNSGVLKSLAKSALHYGVEVTKETLQEVAQESVTIAFTELGKVWHNEAKKQNIPYAEAEEIFQRLKDTAYQSALGFGALQIPGAVVQTTKTITTEKGKVTTPPVKETMPAKTEKVEGPIKVKKPRIEEETVRVEKITERVDKVSKDYQAHIDYFEDVISKVEENEELKAYVSELKGKKAEIDTIATGILKSKDIDISEHLETTEKQIAEQEAIADEVLPKTLEQLYNTLKEAGLEHMHLQWFAEKDMSQIWHSAANKVTAGKKLSDVEINRLMKDIKNNPRKFRVLFAELLNNGEAKKAIAKIEALETEEKDIIENTEKKAVIKHIDEMKDKIREATLIAKRLEIAREVRDAKEKIAILTGKHTIGELLTEEKVEKAIEAVPKTVKKALSEGKKEGVISERLRKKDLIEKANAKKKLKNYVRNLAIKITRPPARTIDFFYRQAIETIQAGIDPKFRMKKTLAAREKLSVFLEKHPEARENISQKILDTLQKKSLNDMTVIELEEIYAEVQRLKKQGRLKKRLKKIQETRRFEELRDNFIDIITKGEGIKEVKGRGKESAKEGIGKKLLGAHLNALRPMRIFDLFDGGKNFQGPVHEFFYNRANKLTDLEYRAIDERIKKVDQAQKELNIKTNDLFKIREIDGIRYSVDEIMDIYCGMKNPLKREAIIYGNVLTEAQSWEFISTLTDKEKALADYIIQEYENNYERLREAHIAYKDEDLGKESNYTPIIRKDIDYDVLEIEIAQELTEQANLKRAYAKRGFTKERIKIAPAHQKPIKLGLLSTWLEQIHKQEHYINGAQIIKELQRMINDKDFAQALRQRFGSEAVRLTKDYVNRIANPNIYKTFDSISKVCRIIREHTAIAYLAYNGVTMLKQLPSVALYLPYSGPGHLIASAFKTALHPMKTVEMIEKLDPQMKHRSLERFTEDFKKAEKGAYDRITKKIGKVGMTGIYFMDKVATTIGWQAVYDKCIKQGLSEEEAVQEARNATLRTQPAAHVKDIAKIYASDKFMSLFLMFSNQLNQIYNILTYDIPMQLKTKKFGQATISVISLGISALLIWSISNRRLPEDEEDIRDALAEQTISSIPILGKEIIAKRKGWMSTGIPGEEALLKIVTAVDIKDEKLRVKWQNILESLAVGLGIPYTGTKRVYKTFETGEPTELIGGKPKEKKKK